MEESIIGRPCNNFDSQFLSDNPKLPTKGVDDNLLCGKAIFENATNQFVEYEWLGYCQRVNISNSFLTIRVHVLPALHGVLK